MSNESGKFTIGIDFASILTAISEQIYETPHAFLRENVQNAVDAIRIQAARDRVSTREGGYEVHIFISRRSCSIGDNGIGMSLDDQRRYFWTMGASGKRTPEAARAGCIGTFGIGGFANLGVCEALKISSMSARDRIGHWTSLTQREIAESVPNLPEARHGQLKKGRRRGTLIEATLREAPDLAELRAYVQDFAQFAPERITFNGELVSQKKLGRGVDPIGTLRALSTDQAQHILENRTPAEYGHAGANLWPSEEYRAVSAKRRHRNKQDQSAVRRVRCNWYEDDAYSLHVELLEMTIEKTHFPVTGFLKVKSGPVSILRRGFKICETRGALSMFYSYGEDLGFTGFIDCDRFSPTAGRDSLDDRSDYLLRTLFELLRDEAVRIILDSSDRIAQNPEVFSRVLNIKNVGLLGKTKVMLAGGDEVELIEVKRRASSGIKIYYSVRAEKSALARHLEARGDTVVMLPTDRARASAAREYLQEYCNAVGCDNQVECSAEYPADSLSKYERMFVAELEEVIVGSYHIEGVKIIVGKLTEDLPVFSPKQESKDLTLYVDVRHREIAKLRGLNNAVLFPSMVRSLCLEYLGETLRKASPRFFGQGAVGIGWLKERAEHWVLVSSEVGIIVTPSDVHRLRVDEPEPDLPANFSPKLLRVEGVGDFLHLSGYYLRIPESLSRGFKDDIMDLKSRAAAWFGNRIALIATDGLGTSFQVEIRLAHLVASKKQPRGHAGAKAIGRPVYNVYDGLYFPIPEEIEPSLVPGPGKKISIKVSYDWLGVEFN